LGVGEGCGRGTKTRVQHSSLERNTVPTVLSRGVKRVSQYLFSWGRSGVPNGAFFAENGRRENRGDKGTRRNGGKSLKRVTKGILSLGRPSRKTRGDVPRRREYVWSVCMKNEGECYEGALFSRF